MFMIELDQTPQRIETTETIETIEGTEAPREDEMGMRVVHHRFTQLPVTHLNRTTKMKAGLSLSTGKPEFPIGFLALQDAFYPSSCTTSSSLLIILSMMARQSRINSFASIPNQLS
jgi:hypothetical protein